MADAIILDEMSELVNAPAHGKWATQFSCVFSGVYDMLMDALRDHPEAVRQVGSMAGTGGSIAVMTFNLNDPRLLSTLEFDLSEVLDESDPPDAGALGRDILELTWLARDVIEVVYVSYWKEA